MEPIYPARDINFSRLLNALSMDLNQPFAPNIPEMPQPSSITQQDNQAEKAAKPQVVKDVSTMGIDAGGKNRRLVGVSIPEGVGKDLDVMARELYLLGELADDSLPSLFRYSMRFFSYNYVNWMRSRIIQSLDSEKTGL